MADSLDPLPRRRVEAIERIAGSFSLVAALIHGLVAPAHFEEWWGYGLFFLFASAAQAMLGLGLLTNAINPSDFGPRWLIAKRRILAVAIIGNLAIILLYVVTRTRGVPLGPDRGEAESLGVLDVASKIAEAIVIGLLLWILLRGPKPNPELGTRPSGR